MTIIEGKITSYEELRLWYRNNRYLKNVDVKDLEQRAKDIICNYLILTENNKIGFRRWNEGGNYWSSALMHVVEEFDLRFGPTPPGFSDDLIKDCHIPDPNFPANKKAIEAFKDLDFIVGKHLIKYGKHEHLKSIYEDGIIQISPASSYNDASLNPAMNDDELKLSIYLDVANINAGTIHNIIMDRMDQFPKEGNITLKIESNSDYYVHCFSSVINFRLFADFKADSCLIITEPQLFFRKLLKAFSDKYQNWKVNGGPIEYIDPLNHKIKDLKEIDNLYLFKHFRYCYQQEYRVLWTPPVAVNNLEPILLQLSDIKEYCNFISLKDTK